MNHRFFGLLYSMVLCATATGQDLSAEPDVPPERTHLPVPRLVKGKLDVSGFQDKLILTLPFYRGDKPAGLRPKLFHADRFNFYDADGNELSAEDAAKFTPSMTSILVIEGYTGDFAGIKRTASLAGGGMVAVMTATQSNQEIDSGGAIATANGLGLDKTFPTTHTGNNRHGWLGRDDQNKGFADPDRFGWLHYDLGAVQRLNGLRIWNYNYEPLLRRAVRDLDVYVSSVPGALGDNNHASWQQVANLNDIPQGPGHTGNAPYGADFTLAKATSARYVRLDVQRNWGNAWNTALAEVQFFALPDKSIFAVTSDAISKHTER